MPYIAKTPIGDYKAGDEVPAEQAEVWAVMYKDSPVELVEGKEEKKAPAPKEEVKEETPSKKTRRKSSSPSDSYVKSLVALEGVGAKTAKDITLIYPDKESLVAAVKENKPLPVRDDVEKELVKAVRYNRLED